MLSVDAFVDGGDDVTVEDTAILVVGPGAKVNRDDQSLGEALDLFVREAVVKQSIYHSLSFAQSFGRHLSEETLARTKELSGGDQTDFISDVVLDTALIVDAFSSQLEEFLVAVNES